MNKLERGNMFEKIKVWYIYCATGCSCCSYENFSMGFYTNKEETEKIINQYRQGIGNPLGSQYAEYGRYSLIETEAELLPDGRVIEDDIVYGSLEGNRWND